MSMVPSTTRVKQLSEEVYFYIIFINMESTIVLPTVLSKDGSLGFFIIFDNFRLNYANYMFKIYINFNYLKNIQK